MGGDYIMCHYEQATICKNGHAISIHGRTSEKCCSNCGAENISQCQNCNANIHGWDERWLPGRKYHVPKYCYNCGKPYPWTEQAIEATKELILEDEELSVLEKDKLSQSLSDIRVETPKTTLAATRIKKALLTAGRFTADALRQFVIDFGCELAIKSINL